MAQPRNDFVLSDNAQDHLDWTNQIGTRAQAYFDVVADYGAVGDGVTDDTAAIQAAIDAKPAGRIATITGAGRSFVVSRLDIPSDIIVEGFQFITKAYDGTTGEFYSPLTVGDYNDTTTRENITFRNVHVNGNRENQTGEGLIGEDGGRHGFRLLGPIENLTIEACSATYCATDGIAIYSGIGMSSVQSYNSGLKKRITVRDCVFSHNRRHGASIDDVEDLSFRDCVFGNNGNTEGVSTGTGYGNGVTYEGYQAKSWLGRLLFDKCTSLDNAREGFLVFSSSAVDSSDVNFVPRGPIAFNNCESNVGIDASAPVYAYTITPHAPNKALGEYFVDVSLTDCVSTDGAILLRSVDGAVVTGGAFASPYLNADTSTRVRLNNPYFAGDIFQTDATLLEGFYGEAPQTQPDGVSPSKALTDLGLLANSAAGTFNVRDYGATGDGVTDDYTAVNSAVAAAGAAGGGVVFFPPGTFLLETALQWNDNNVTLRGASRDVSIIKTDSLVVTAIIANGTDFVIENLRFDAASSYLTVNMAEPRGVIRNCWFDGGPTAIYSDNDGGLNTDFLIENNVFTSDSAIWLYRGPDNVTVRGNDISDWGTTRPAIYINGDASTEKHCSNLLIEGNYLHDPDETVGNGNVETPIKSDGVGGKHRNVIVSNNILVGTDKEQASSTGTPDQIALSSCDGLIVEGNISIDGGDMGITVGVSGSSQNVTVVGNSCYNNDIAGIWIDATEVTVTGNTCVNNGQNRAAGATTDLAGIGLSANADSVTISGNTCTDNQGTETQEYGITITSGATNIKLGDNLLVGNGTAAYNDLEGIFEVAAATTLDWSHNTLNVDSAGATRAITLPDNASFIGKVYFIHRDGSNSVTVTRAGSDTFDDAATVKTLGSDGAGIHIFSIGDGEWKILQTVGTVT